ncbi:serine hydrolase domain-containing protein [Micromonospora sp. WMMD1082]|uniref:serine hydrolase domain-containing protein n=1 Tax=Micromonospora sp. WMMD1082 TaxID=3016104 RepID=UPI00241774B1|nr:serine hydrolase domain-containing protein [Micromonospora sp. WMMD1082]MDG4792766.1 serine hydrolase [Micromonospora sp. WMMD1082]
MHRRTVLTGLSSLALAGTGALGLSSAPAAGVGLTRPRTDSRTRELTTLLATEVASGMPGTYAEVREAGKTLRVAAGVADVTTGRPAHQGGYHRIGGATKTFVAVAVLQLVAQRRIDLDKPIGWYLPDVIPGERGRQITVRMLLNHTSGLAEFTRLSLAEEGETVPRGVLFGSLASIADTAGRWYPPRELARIGLALPSVAAPGTIWSYSNTGYVLLGLLLERVTWSSYEDVLTRQVLGPLGLRQSFLPRRQRRLPGPHLTAYVPWSDDRLRPFTTYDMSWAWANCDLVSTASDLNRFYRALLSGQILAPTLLAEMMTTVPMSPLFPDSAGYGLGLHWIRGQCGPAWGHDGFVIGHNTFVRLTPDGTTAQFTLTENLNFYPGMSTMMPANPIDLARAQFMTSAMSGCATGTTGLASRADAPTELIAHPGWLHRISALAN